MILSVWRIWQSESPSSRRAWIEIHKAAEWQKPGESPSSRRAWIEISSVRSADRGRMVALLAEGVDRNMW